MLYFEHSARQLQTVARWVGCTLDNPGLIYKSFRLKHNDCYICYSDVQRVSRLLNNFNQTSCWMPFG